MITITNVIQEIISIFKDEKEHNLKFIIEPYQFHVYLMYDPEGNFDEETIIPITYDSVDEFCYIEDKKYRELHNCEDYGIEHHEINLIKQVMDCIMEHKNEIEDICSNLYWEDREKNSKENSQKKSEVTECNYSESNS